MAEKFRPQRVRSFYPLAGPGPFLSSNPSDISSGNSRRPYTGSFQVSSVKPLERTGTQLSKRVSTAAVDYSRRRHNYRESPRTLETSQLDATGDHPTLKDSSCKSPIEATSVTEDGESATTSERPVVAEIEIIRPKRTITVFLPSLKMTDDEDDNVVMDNCKSHASLTDSTMRNGATSTQQHLIDGQSRVDQRLVVASSNDRGQLDRSDRQKSAVPVYKIKYVHFDKNRAAVGHARQITNRLYAINVQRQSSALNRIELA